MLLASRLGGEWARRRPKLIDLSLVPRETQHHVPLRGLASRRLSSAALSCSTPTSNSTRAAELDDSNCFKAREWSLQGPEHRLTYVEDRNACRLNHWSHFLFRGPAGQKVIVHHCYSLEDSERIAQMFLNEPIVGFDTGWPTAGSGPPGLELPLKQRISSIQLACEDKVAIFHIDLIPGETVNELIAPSLRKIIESPRYAKAGVGVLECDFRRLRRFFRLWPRGAFELTYLHYVLNYAGGTSPFKQRRMALPDLVRTYMNLTLAKTGVFRDPGGKARQNRSRTRFYWHPASDAFAGYMLFHRMNAARLQMQVVPPLPLYAESQSRGNVNGAGLFVKKIDLGLQNEDGRLSPIKVSEFFALAILLRKRVPRELKREERTRLLWDHISFWKWPKAAAWARREKIQHRLMRSETAVSHQSAVRPIFGSGWAKAQDLFGSLVALWRKQPEPQVWKKHIPLPTYFPLPHQEIKIFHSRANEFKLAVERRVGHQTCLPDVPLKYMAHQPPETIEQLRSIPGITEFLSDCDRAELDFLKYVRRWAPRSTPRPKPGMVQGGSRSILKDNGRSRATEHSGQTPQGNHAEGLSRRPRNDDRAKPGPRAQKERTAGKQANRKPSRRSTVQDRAAWLKSAASVATQSLVSLGHWQQTVHHTHAK